MKGRETDLFLDSLGTKILRLRQNDHNLADDIFKCIFLNKFFCILIEISLKFVLKGFIKSII